MDNDLFVIFQGIMEELMLAADPMLYRKYILHRKKGEALLYVFFTEGNVRLSKEPANFLRETG